MQGKYSPIQLFSAYCLQDVPLVKSLKDWIEAERSTEEVHHIVIRRVATQSPACDFDDIYRCMVVYTDDDRQVKRFHEDGTECLAWAS